MSAERFVPAKPTPGAMIAVVAPEVRSAHALEHIASRLDDLAEALQSPVAHAVKHLPGWRWCRDRGTVASWDESLPWGCGLCTGYEGKHRKLFLADA